MGLAYSDFYSPQSPISPFLSYGVSPDVHSFSSLKGLENRLGKNNCFLNVVIQCLWHLTPFREKFLFTMNSGHVHYHDEKDLLGASPSSKDKACIFCALKTIFTQYEVSENKLLMPNVLREALSVRFRLEDKFQLGNMDDASEAFCEILDYIHNALTFKVENNGELLQLEVCEPLCPVHKCFGMNILERVECNCGATSEPFISPMYMYNVYIMDIQEVLEKSKIEKFDCILAAINEKELKPCPERTLCSRLSSNQKFLQSQPEIFSIGLIWDSSSPSSNKVKPLLRKIDETVDLRNIFYGAPAINTQYRLSCLICYSSMLHYIALVFSKEMKRWVVFDDEKVKKIGATWEEVVKYCTFTNFLPCLLFYESQTLFSNSLTNNNNNNNSIFNESPLEEKEYPTLNDLSNLSVISSTVTREFIIGIDGHSQASRYFDALDCKWQLIAEITEQEYISITIRRTDIIPRILRISIQFDCTVEPYTFSSKVSKIEIGPNGGFYTDPFFICPQRQKLVGLHGKFGLIITIIGG